MTGHLDAAPAELTEQPLRRIGEGIGRIAYASPCWVVKRQRTPSEVMALIVLWRILRFFERAFPLGVAERMMAHPSRRLRFLRVLIEGLLRIVPKGLWFTKYVLPVWQTYQQRSLQGAELARQKLRDSDVAPRVITFPPTAVRIRGWPGWLIVSEAEERAEATLLDRLSELAQAGFFPDVEELLDRLLETRQSGWQLGLFSVDAHLKNFGVIGDRVVLLDTGGLTDKWSDIEARLEQESAVEEPHVRLGLGPLLVTRPDIAARFNARWKATVSVEGVQQNWPNEVQRPA